MPRSQRGDQRASHDARVTDELAPLNEFRAVLVDVFDDKLFDCGHARQCRGPAVFPTRHTTGTLATVPVGIGSFGMTLRRLRERAGLTQEQLAEAAGLSPRAIRALERGERRQPYQHTVEALAKALGLTSVERTELLSAVPTRGARDELPVAPTRLIGRTEEVRRVVDGFVSGQTRLITLTGPGGVGKSRLALAAAHELLPNFVDGVVFISLADLREPALVLPTVAHSLGLSEGGTRPLRQVLSDYLSHRQMLIVLDNLEHLLLPAASALASLLSSAPQLGVLTTSRSSLRIRGEQVYPVHPLDQAAAVELFSERVRQSAADTSAADGPVVTEICRRLDHLPLAIELAAARMRVLPAAALLANLDHALGVAGDGARDLPQRQQTLRDTLDWSYDLLTATEQTMLRQLGIFSGGWTLEAAVAVAQSDDVTILALHARLLDCSLITREPGEHDGRFSLLETVRSYAREKLEASDEFDAVLTRHTVYYRDLALVGMADLYGPAQPGWLVQLEAVHDNLRAVLQRMLDLEQLEDMADMCLALYTFWLIRDHHLEGEGWAHKALARDHGSLSTGARAKLLFIAAGTLYARTRYDEAAAKYDQAASLAREAGDPLTLSLILVMSGYVAVQQGGPEVAIKFFLDEAESLGLQIGDEFVLAHVCIVRAQAALCLNQVSEGDQLLTESMAGIRARDPWTVAFALTFNGFSALLVGDHPRAEKLLRESIAILSGIENTSVMLWSLPLLALTAVEASDPRRAARLLGAAEAVIERTGASIPPIFDQLSATGYRRTLDEVGPDAFGEFCEQGRHLPLHEVMSLA